MRGGSGAEGQGREGGGELHLTGATAASSWFSPGGTTQDRQHVETLRFPAAAPRVGPGVFYSVPPASQLCEMSARVRRQKCAGHRRVRTQQRARNRNGFTGT